MAVDERVIQRELLVSAAVHDSPVIAHSGGGLRSRGRDLKWLTAWRLEGRIGSGTVLP